jgi:hypothetical protein
MYRSLLCFLGRRDGLGSLEDNIICLKFDVDKVLWDNSVDRHHHVDLDNRVQNLCIQYRKLPDFGRSDIETLQHHKGDNVYHWCL